MSAPDDPDIQSVAQIGPKYWRLADADMPLRGNEWLKNALTGDGRGWVSEQGPPDRDEYPLIYGAGASSPMQFLGEDPLTMSHRDFLALTREIPRRLAEIIKSHRWIMKIETEPVDPDSRMAEISEWGSSCVFRNEDGSVEQIRTFVPITRHPMHLSTGENNASNAVFVNGRVYFESKSESKYMRRGQGEKLLIVTPDTPRDTQDQFFVSPIGFGANQLFGFCVKKYLRTDENKLELDSMKVGVAAADSVIVKNIIGDVTYVEQVFYILAETECSKVHMPNLDNPANERDVFFGWHMEKSVSYVRGFGKLVMPFVIELAEARGTDTYANFLSLVADDQTELRENVNSDVPKISRSPLKLIQRDELNGFKVVAWSSSGYLERLTPQTTAGIDRTVQLLERQDSDGTSFLGMALDAARARSKSTEPKLTLEVVMKYVLMLQREEKLLKYVPLKPAKIYSALIAYKNPDAISFAMNDPFGPLKRGWNPRVFVDETPDEGFGYMPVMHKWIHKIIGTTVNYPEEEDSSEEESSGEEDDMKDEGGTATKKPGADTSEDESSGEEDDS